MRAGNGSDCSLSFIGSGAPMLRTATPIETGTTNPRSYWAPKSRALVVPDCDGHPLVQSSRNCTTLNVIPALMRAPIGVAYVAAYATLRGSSDPISVPRESVTGKSP